MNKIIAIVGMPGAGKTEAAEFLVKKGFQFIRSGQITMDEIKKRGLEISEVSEKSIREEFRKKYGMAAYAILNFPKIDRLLEKGSVVLDGMRSWEEYIEFKKKYGKNIIVIAVYASPETRYRRLSGRKWDKKNDPDIKKRSFMAGESASRDKAEIENLHLGGTIAMADFTITNESTIESLKDRIDEILEEII